MGAGIAIEIGLNVAALLIGKIREARAAKQAHVDVSSILPDKSSISIEDALTIILQVAGKVLEAWNKDADEIDPESLYIVKNSDQIIAEG